MKTNIKFLLRQNKTKYTIYIRHTKDRKQSYITTGIEIEKKNWDEQKEQVKNNYTFWLDDFQKIDFLKQKANEIITSELLTEKNITFNDFKEFLFNIKKSIDFETFIKSEIEKRKHLITISTYNSQLTQLKKILRFQQKIDITGIDKNFIEKYHKSLIERGLQKTTIGKALSSLRTFLNWALENELIKKNPFENVKIAKGEGNRQFLDVLELQTLYNLYLEKKLNTRLQNVLQIFLFACFTGLRFTDVRLLRFNNIKDDFIDFVQHKTSERNRLFINEYAKALLPTCNNINDFVFKKYANQTINRFIKEIMVIAGINKSVSFHCARHTFATVSLQINIPIEIISKSLGHSKIATTQIYAKLVDETKKQQLSKWNNVF